MENHLHLTRDSLHLVCRRVISEFSNLHLDQELCKKLARDFLGPVQRLLANYADHMSTEMLNEAFQHHHNMFQELYRVAHRAHILVERCCEEKWWRILFTQACASHCEEALDIVDDLRWCMAEIGKNSHFPKEPTPGRAHFKQSFKECEESDRRVLLNKLEHLVSNLEKHAPLGPFPQSDFQLSKFLLGRMKVLVISSIPIDQIEASLDYQKFNVEGKNGFAEPRCLGEGAAGSVIATDFLSIQCARKDQEAFSDVELQEFAKQAVKLSKLSHPHVIKTFGFYSKKRSDEAHKGFFLMELMSGSLYDEMKKGKKKQLFPLRVAVDIMIQMAKGVRYLHENGISHRDLKCHNILVRRLLIPSELANTPYKEYQDIKVTDFDQAKFFTGNSSDWQLQSRPNVGSTPWRAPECNTEKGKGSVVKVNPKRADSYSFAMTCYELLSVEDSPFHAMPVNGMAGQKILAIKAGMRPPIPEACPLLLKRLIRDCWRNEAPQRPDFDEIHRRLQDVQSVLLTDTLSERNRQCDGASASLQKRGVRMMSTMFKHITFNASNAAHKLLKVISPQMHSGITEVVPPSNKDGSNKEHDTLSVAKVVVGLDFGTTHSGVAYAIASNPHEIHTISWPSVAEEVYHCKTLTAIFRSTPNGDWVWGYPARKEYASRYGREDAQDIEYFRELKQSLSSMDSGSNELQPVVEYLRKLGSFVLEYLQHNAECSEKQSLKMDHLRWCITVPSDWTSDSKEFQSFGACLEMAGLVQGQAFDMFRESDAAARHCFMDCFSSAHLERGDGICVLDIGSGNLQCVFEDWHDVERTQNAYGSTLSSAESLIKENFFRFICEKVGQVSDADLSVNTSLLDADLEYSKAYPDHSIRIPKTDIHIKFSSSDWGVIFKPLVDEVVSFLQEQLQKNSFVNLKRLFVVGGYGKYARLIEEIERSFPAVIIYKSLKNPGSAICKGAVALGLMLLQARTQHNGSSSNSEGGGEETNLDGGTRGADSNEHGQPGSSQPGSSQKLNPSTSTYSSATDSKGKKKANAKDELEDFLPEKMLVALDFGTSQMSFAYSRASHPSEITICEEHQRRTMDFYYEFQDNNLCLRSSGREAHLDCGANIPGEYVSKPKLHILVDDLDPELELSLPTGLTIDNVISDSLREYGEFILQVLQEKFGESFELQHIQWCLLVPSFWGENVKRGMRTCMVNAGLLRGARNVDASPYPLVTVLEAEAASIACIRSLNLCKGMKFMVASIGGGALDMVCHEMIGESYQPCNMRELSMSAGGFYGSTCLDLNFLTFLSMRLGAWIGKYLKRNPCVLNNLLSQWEQMKADFFDDCEPSTLVLPKTLQDAWRYSKPISSSEPLESLQLTFEDVKMIFEPVVRTILERIAAQLGQTSNVYALVLVGEFARAPYLFGHIEHKFRDQVKSVIRLDSKSEVLKGAILFGLQQKIIRSRVARKTYGLGMSLDFQVGLCSTKEESDEVERFRIDVERGSRVEVDSCVTSVHKLHSHAQKNMKFTLYSSVESYPRYTDEESVTKEWDFMVDTSDCVTLDEEPRIEVILYYGRSAIEIEAKGVNFRSGSLLPVTFVTEAMSQRNVVAPSVARRTYGIGVLNTREKWDLLKYSKRVDGEDLCDFCFEPYIQKGTQLDYFTSRTLFPIHHKQQYLPFKLYSSSETSPVYVTDDAVMEEGALEIDIRKGLIVDKDREVSVRMWFNRTDIKISAVALNFANPEDRNLPIRLRHGTWENQVTLNLTGHLRVVPLQSGALRVVPLQSSVMDNAARARAQKQHWQNTIDQQQELLQPPPKARSHSCPVAILWDIENCPVPGEVNAEDVAGNIRIALREHPHVGAVTMFSAYGDFNHFPRKVREGCQRTGANLIDVPSSKKDVADKSILVDMFLFALDNPPPSTIFLITGDVDFAPALHKLGQRGYVVVLVIPDGVGVSSALRGAGRFVYDWPCLCRGEGLRDPQRQGRNFNSLYPVDDRGQNRVPVSMYEGRIPVSQFQDAYPDYNMPWTQEEADPHKEESPLRTHPHRWPRNNVYNVAPVDYGHQHYVMPGQVQPQGPRTSYRSSHAAQPGQMRSQASGGFVDSRGRSGISAPESAHVMSSPGMQGGEAEEPTSPGESSPLWVQPGDLTGLKRQLVQLLNQHGGKMMLSKVPAEYNKLFGRPLYLSEYNAQRMVHLIDKMKDTLVIKEDGTSKTLHLARKKTGRVTNKSTSSSNQAFSSKGDKDKYANEDHDPKGTGVLGKDVEKEMAMDSFDVGKGKEMAMDSFDVEKGKEMAMDSFDVDKEKEMAMDSFDVEKEKEMAMDSFDVEKEKEMAMDSFDVEKGMAKNSVDGSRDDTVSTKEEDKKVEEFVGDVHRTNLTNFKQQLQELLVAYSYQIPYNDFVMAYQQRFACFLDLPSLGVVTMEALFDKVKDVAVIKEKVEKRVKRLYLVAVYGCREFG